jgi:hypothetical protein
MFQRLVLVGYIVAVTTGIAAAQEEHSSESTRTYDPGSAFRRSLVFPGWGQWYNEERVEAFVWGGVFWTSIGIAIHNWDTSIGYDGPGSIFWSANAWTHGRNNWLILAGVTYLLCAVDAYVDAHMKSFDVEPIAYRDTRDGWHVGLKIALPIAALSHSRSLRP